MELRVLLSLKVGEKAPIFFCPEQVAALTLALMSRSLLSGPPLFPTTSVGMRMETGLSAVAGPLKYLREGL